MLAAAAVMNVLALAVKAAADYKDLAKQIGDIIDSSITEADMTPEGIHAIKDRLKESMVLPDDYELPE